MAALLLTATWVAPSAAQEISIEMHWVGTFGPYSPHPLPNDPLPDITLFPFGEIPRPLVKTNTIPGKLGTRFGLLFTLHGGGASVVQVMHFPAPGVSVRPGGPKLRDVEVPMVCMANRPCYVGYLFERHDEILSGEWRMELLVNGATAYEAKFAVEPEAELVFNQVHRLRSLNRRFDASTPAVVEPTIPATTFLVHRRPPGEFSSRRPFNKFSPGT
jgi:hypothetical protein